MISLQILLENHNTYSNFENRITGVPQDSIVGPLLFDFSVKDLVFFIDSS